MVEKQSQSLTGGTAKTDEKLWTNTTSAFKAAFTNATKQQDTQHCLLNLWMQGWELDQYATKFENLVTRTKYSITDHATIELFIGSLVPALTQEVMKNPTLKPHEMTFEEWKVAATDQQRRNQYICNHTHQTPFSGQKCRGKSYREWRRALGLPLQQGTKVHTQQPCSHHLDTMDVDLVWATTTTGGSTQGSHMLCQQYTDEEKQKLLTKGRCFRCQGQGHFARECPTKDT